MNYELAEKLKDAGFPQEGDWDDPCHTYWSTYDGAASKSDPQLIEGHEANFGFMEDLYFVPTLSELIEACGDGFTALHSVAGGFRADGHKYNIEDCEHDGECGGTHFYEGEAYKTPEEAVANLWLKLNEK